MRSREVMGLGLLSVSLSLISDKLGFIMEAEMDIGYWVTRALLCIRLISKATARTNRSPQASVKVALSLFLPPYLCHWHQRIKGWSESTNEKVSVR